MKKVSANSIIEDALKVKVKMDNIIIEALDPEFPAPHLDPPELGDVQGDNIIIKRKAMFDDDESPDWLPKERPFWTEGVD